MCHSDGGKCSQGVSWCVCAFFLFSQRECSFLYMGPTFIHDKVTLPNYLCARNLLDFDFIKRKLPQDMSDVMSFDSEQYRRVFHKASECSPAAKFIKCNDVWFMLRLTAVFFPMLGSIRSWSGA